MMNAFWQADFDGELVDWKIFQYQLHSPSLAKREEDKEVVENHLISATRAYYGRKFLAPGIPRGVCKLGARYSAHHAGNHGGRKIAI